MGNKEVVTSSNTYLLSVGMESLKLCNAISFQNYSIIFSQIYAIGFSSFNLLWYLTISFLYVLFTDSDEDFAPGSGAEDQDLKEE